ncbi:uncharacterized protein PHACADRAFT_124758 [Phanerochaete carnosa HHB-10118-sp]|uniref:Microtubule associated protein n=1 Tax=Phanerochaete carnosa (strain HHB-10118-sp) TaxID=650164 RepID=K5W2B6_PHACS|nr:uncharacterized protein PHACADRAFT_124758 [Phanerochaete carnosa HHB-10118-sp]EKM53255.1 hypothetical protein PHACADRAFT_124758 [Phanerochaete carnosa HHB-10118-sp]
MTTSATTITSLLNSLHTHLQSQTQLLPTLHNQLGLPQTALADDLSALQRQLAECVESQIDLRRMQVDEWMGRCDAVERECVRYTKALGGHVKATGSSVGEVRKEQVLPRRFDMISEYQEKLRQLYHTKLEQLATFTSRIDTLSRTLGPEYFPSDILEPIRATGESEGDPDARRDVTPERFSKLEKELVRGKGEVGKRMHHLSLTLSQIDYLYTELGITPQSPADSGSSSSSRPQSACSLQASGTCPSSDPFLSSSDLLATPTPTSSRSKANTPYLLNIPSDDAPHTPNNEAEYHSIFNRFVTRLDELGEEAVTDPNKPSVGLEGVDPIPDLVRWAETTQANLEDIKRRREAHIQAMYDQLESLWRRLGVADTEMDAFIEAQRGSTEVTVRAYEEELDRMLELKREKMSTFIESARSEITQLWDELMVSEDERADFAPFADDEHTEELLAIHEEEIRRLKEERKLKGPLLKSIQKYFDICEDEKDLAAAAADQTRLLGRGPRDPGRLLREEKMRKRVTKEKPRLKQDLLNSIPAWEAQTGRTFLVRGQSVMQILQEASQTQEKENSTKRGKTRTASGSAPRAKTPSYAPSSSVSSSSKPAVTPAVPARPPSTTGRNTRSASAAAARQPRSREAPSAAANNYNTVPPLPVPIVPMNTSRNTRAPSPFALRAPTITNGKTPASVPRPQGIAASKRETPMTGRVGSAQKPRTRNYHPYARPTRSATKSHAPPPAVRVYGAVGLNSSAAAPPAAGTARKASARRESFRPRPSMDHDNWAGESTSDKRFTGFAGGMVQEEDEDF